MQQKEIKNYVRRRYGEIAKNVISCCKSTSADMALNLRYSEEDLKSIPESSNMGLGCGNPVALASLKEGETVLDLGSGRGIDVFFAAKRVGSKGKVIGVDMTEEMVKKARETAMKHGYENVEFKLGDIEDLPIEDDSIDIIISNCVINLAPDKERVFQEAYRALKPGGRIMISDIVTEGELSKEVKQSLEAWAGCVAGALERGQYLTLMKRAGFRNAAIVSERTSGDCCLNAKIVSVQVQGFKLRDMHV